MASVDGERHAPELACDQIFVRRRVVGQHQVGLPPGEVGPVLVADYDFNVGRYAVMDIDKESIFVARVEAILDGEHTLWHPVKNQN